MRVDENPLLPQDAAYLVPALSDILRSHAQKVNQLADGKLVAIDNALTTAPTTGQWMTGDFVRNSAPVEAGAASSKFVVFGWLCSVGGTPGTWLPFRFLTGN